MKSAAHHDKPIIGLLCVVIAFAMFLIFYQNKEVILLSENMTPFLVLMTLGLGLLLGLFYLVSNRVDKHTSKSKKKK